MVNLRPGLNILIDEYTLQDDLVVDYGEDEPCDPRQHLEMSFMLSGHNLPKKMRPCHSFILAKWKGWYGGQFDWQAGDRVLKFDIHIKPTLFKALVGEQLDVLPPLLYALSYRDLEEMMAERGLSVDHSMINRWVLQYGPELDKRCRPHLRMTNDSWKVDETYVKVKGE
jgi:hypothetical protein